MRRLLNCVYCGKEAPTRDHVIARTLLEKPYPPNLPTVPSCKICNQDYGKDEQYFLAVLAMTGAVPSLEQKVEEGGAVDRTLERSIGLDSHVIQSLQVSEDGRPFIVPDERRIANVTLKIAFGLYIDRYKPSVIPPIGGFLPLKPMYRPDIGHHIVAISITARFRPRRWIHLQPRRYNGKITQIFDFMFARGWLDGDRGKLFCIMRFHETIWGAVQCPTPSIHMRRSHPILRSSAAKGTV